MRKAHSATSMALLSLLTLTFTGCEIAGPMPVEAGSTNETDGRTNSPPRTVTSRTAPAENEDEREHPADELAPGDKKKDGKKGDFHPPGKNPVQKPVPKDPPKEDFPKKDKPHPDFPPEKKKQKKDPVQEDKKRPDHGERPDPHPGEPGEPGEPGAGNDPECVSDPSDPDGQLCLAVKYVVFDDRSGEAFESLLDVSETLQKVNATWKNCGIGFVLEDYEAVDPAEYRINHNVGWHSELSRIRDLFEDRQTLLVVVTGTWRREGDLGSNGHWGNAWTTLPGEGRYGVVLERPVSRFSNLIAHELGHYLSLDHDVHEYSNLMHPIIGEVSSEISGAQCQRARDAAELYWKDMLR